MSNPNAISSESDLIEKGQKLQLEKKSTPGSVKRNTRTNGKLVFRNASDTESKTKPSAKVLQAKPYSRGTTLDIVQWSDHKSEVSNISEATMKRNKQGGSSHGEGRVTSLRSSLFKSKASFPPGEAGKRNSSGRKDCDTDNADDDDAGKQTAAMKKAAAMKRMADLNKAIGML